MAVQGKRGISSDSLADEARVIAGKAKAITLTYDKSTYFSHDEIFGKADRLVLESGHDRKKPVDNTFGFELNDREFAGNTRQMTIDARELGGQELASISTGYVTSYTIKFLGGEGNDFFLSGIGGDTAKMGGGDDYVLLGTGDDAIAGGSGDDTFISGDGDFNAGDTLNGGDGNDQLTTYLQSMSDADLANVRSVEWLAVSGGSSIELDASAARAGVRELFVDQFGHQAITLGAGFTGSLLVHNQGALPDAMTFDASASSATVTIEAGNDTTRSAPTYIGGSGAEDTIKISNGYDNEFTPLHGGDLSNVKGFEHVVVEDQGGDSGAYLVLRTLAGDIASAFQTVDAGGLAGGKSFQLLAGDATAALHVTSGAGADLLITGRGADVIDGGLGADTITGGAGRDTFVYDALADSYAYLFDQIVDFTSGKDKIDVTGLGADMPSLSGATINFLGNLDYQSGTVAVAGTAGDGVLDAVYLTDNRTLWFDVNDDGFLNPEQDLHIGLGATLELQGADVLAGHMVI